MPVEQRHAEAFLERADLPADGGLAEIERLARMGEAARLGNRMKNPQLVPVHRHLLAFRGPSPRSPDPPPLFGGARGRGILRYGEKLLRLERGHAAEPRGGHRLAKDLVLDVAGSE